MFFVCFCSFPFGNSPCFKKKEGGERNQVVSGLFVIAFLPLFLLPDGADFSQLNKNRLFNDVWRDDEWDMWRGAACTF